MLTLGLMSRNTLRGIMVFALPPSQTYVRYGCPTWELARLWCDDVLPRNTESWFIAQAVKYIKRHHHNVVSALVSYADPSMGHSGTVYKAANWLCDGRTDSDRKTPRFDYVVGDKVYSRRAHVPDGAVVVRKPRVSKHRFIYWLNTDAMKTWKRKSHDHRILVGQSLPR